LALTWPVLAAWAPINKYILHSKPRCCYSIGCYLYKWTLLGKNSGSGSQKNRGRSPESPTPNPCIYYRYPTTLNFKTTDIQFYISLNLDKNMICWYTAFLRINAALE
jgi:hypothetical protein